MASRAPDSVDLLTTGLGCQPVREQSAPESSADTALVRAARDGNREAFGRLYERYARMVHGVLLAKVPVDAVDDLVQDVFVRALRHLSTLRRGESLGAWLATIARNLANDYHRRSPPANQLSDHTSDHHIAREPSSAGHEGPAAEILNAIRSLPDAYRETLLLRLVEGMTGPEIAARTGLTHGSVRVNLHRGMQQLRAKLSPASTNHQSDQETL
jgi:RNA polymerase sigma-70 factor, ECF subfamily